MDPMGKDYSIPVNGWMSLSPWLETRSEFEFWLHGSSRYSAVGQMRPPNEVIVKQQEVTTLDNQFQGDVFKYEPF